MTNETVKLIELEITKLELKPGQILAMFAPPDWTPMQIGVFSSMLDLNSKSPASPLYGVKFIVFPNDLELEIVSPPEGFGF